MSARRRWTLAVLLALAMAAGVASCGDNQTPGQPSPPPPPIGGGPVERTLVGAGDIGECGLGGAEATARLLDRIDGTVFTAGDNAYFQGSAQQFRDCYHPHWGRHRGRTRPTPGNHDYETAGGAGYYEYFGESAAPNAPGYYSYQLGAWQIYALNTVIDIGAASPQAQWLRRELQTNRNLCSLVIMHHPRFSSGPNGGLPSTADLWRAMYEGGVDVIVSGDEHLYERLVPLDADGRRDDARGMRQFIVGTGGAALYPVARIVPASEVRGTGTWGVIRFTLRERDYLWEFVPVDGGSFRDSGSAPCH